MPKINLTPAAIDAINVFLDRDELEHDIELLNDAMDEYLDISGDTISREEAQHRLDMASNLRRVSKNFMNLLKAIEPCQ